MSPEAENALDALCEQLARATLARKVLLCAPDGRILAHAGVRGLFSNQVSNALAQLAADLLTHQLLDQLIEAQRSQAGAQSPIVPADSACDGEPGEESEAHFAQAGRLRVCATPLAARALLLVLFDESVEAGLVRVRVRRIRRLLLRVLTEQDPGS